MAANGDDNSDDNTKQHTFSSATSEIKERLSKYGLDKLASVLIEAESIISGSFPLQCIIDEVWPTSDIDIFCKNISAHEFIEEYLLSLESSNKVDITREKQYSGYRLVTNYKINHNGNEIIIELIAANSYYVVNHLESDIDMDVCRVYFDGYKVFSYTDPSKFENRQATFDQRRRTYGPGGQDCYVTSEVKDQHIRQRRRKYEDRGFTVEMELSDPVREEYQPPLYLDEQIKAPQEVHELLMRRLSDYNLDGIDEFLKGYIFMTGDFLLNCVLDEHWTDTVITIHSYTSEEFRTFLSDRGYSYKYRGITRIHIFYIPDPQYEGEPDCSHTDITYPIIKIYPYVDTDITTFYQKAGLDLEKICYNKNQFYSYTPWVKIKRRIGYVRGNSIDLEVYTKKYEDRDILITDDKNNTGAVVKSATKR